jgi:hypothetical protein
MLFIDAGGNFLEIEADAGGLQPSARRGAQAAHGGGDGGDPERALEQVAAVESGCDHVTDGEVGAGVPTDVFRCLIGLGRVR